MNESMQKALKGVMTLGVICTQWGDTGKGKLIDYFSQWADIVARGTGGANAGHTICVNGETYIFHLLPSGILHTEKINIIGNGVVLDPHIVLEEVGILAKADYTCDNLKIAYNAKLVLPQHLVMDRAKDIGKGRIGTTGRGIGPAYTDHCARFGLIVNDMLNPEIFKAKLKRNLKDKVKLLREFPIEKIKEIMDHDHLENGKFFDEKEIFNVEAITEHYLKLGQELKRFITDTDKLLREALCKKHILLEGAQGTLLSIDYGSYPYVTSSDSTIQNLPKGVGLSTADVDLVYNIVKALYMTRVGEGPFPTEFGGTKSAEYCGQSGITAETEKKEYPEVTLDPDGDEFMFGVNVRRAGSEYGATTGRPRRNGWLDLPLLRHSLQVAGKHGQTIALTKIDVLDKCPTIKVCTSYKYTGPDYNMGGTTLKKGDTLETAILLSEILEHSEPIYQEFSGWMTDITKIKEFDELPEKLKTIIKFIEKEAKTSVGMVSVGPDREQTILT